MDLDAALARQLQVTHSNTSYQEPKFGARRIMSQCLKLSPAVQHPPTASRFVQAEEQLQARQAGLQAQQGTNSLPQQQAFASRLHSCLQHTVSVRFGNFTFLGTATRVLVVSSHSATNFAV